MLRSLKRYSATIGLLVALAISLAGCVHIDRAVTINNDGSGSYTLTIGFSEQLLSLAGGDQFTTGMDSYGQQVKSDGGSYRQYDDAGYKYWAYTRPYKTIADLNQLVQQAPQTGNSVGSSGSTPSLTQSDTLTFSEQPGFLGNSFHVTGHMSMIVPQSATDTGGVDVSTYLNDMRESFSVTMPGSITSHKGGSVSGNTVSYTIHYGQQTDIDVVGGGFNTALLLPIGIAVVVILLLIGGFIFWRRRRSATRVAAPEAAPAFVAAAPDAPTTPGFDAPQNATDAGAAQG